MCAIKRKKLTSISRDIKRESYTYSKSVISDATENKLIKNNNNNNNAHRSYGQLSLPYGKLAKRKTGVKANKIPMSSEL